MRSLARMALTLGAGLVVGLLGNAVHPRGLRLGQPVWSQAESGQCSAGELPALSESGAPGVAPATLTVEEARALMKKPNVVIGDLRSADEYATGHIASAIHFPCSGRLGQEALSRVPIGARLLLYDADGRSPQLHIAAATLRQRGISEVYLLSGGFMAWQLGGLPAESGTCESCGGH